MSGNGRASSETQYSGSTYPNSDPMIDGGRHAPRRTNTTVAYRAVGGRSNTKINREKTRATGKLVYEPIEDKRHPITPRSGKEKPVFDMKKIGNIDTILERSKGDEEA